MSQELELSRAIKLSEAVYRERCEYDYQRVFWGSVYGVGLVGLGWVSIKLGLMVADAAEAAQGLIDQARIKELEARAVLLETQIKLKAPAAQELPWWMIAILNPVSSFTFGLPELIYKYLTTPDDDPEIDALKQELLEVYAELEALKAPREVQENKAAGLVRRLDGVYGAVGPVLPAALLSYNALTEYIRVRKLREEEV